MAELCNKHGNSKYCKLPSDIIYNRILYNPLEVKGLFATLQSGKDPLIPTVIYRLYRFYDIYIDFMHRPMLLLYSLDVI